MIALDYYSCKKLTMNHKKQAQKDIFSGYFPGKKQGKRELMLFVIGNFWIQKTHQFNIAYNCYLNKFNS